MGRKCCFLWWPRGAFPTAENTSERRRAAVGVIRRSAVGRPSEKYVRAPSGRHRAAVGAPSDRRRSEDARRLGNEGINSLVPRPSPSSAPRALRIIIKCGGGKTAASVFPPPHLIITRNAHGAEEGERPGNEARYQYMTDGAPTADRRIFRRPECPSRRRPDGAPTYFSDGAPMYFSDGGPTAARRRSDVFSTVGNALLSHHSFHSQRATLHALRSRCTARVYSAGDDSKRVTRVSQFTTVKQVRERKIERLGKRQALYTRLYFPRGFWSRKWPNCAAICGVQDTAHFRRRASSSLGLFTGLCGVVAFRFPSLSIQRSLFLASSL